MLRHRVLISYGYFAETLEDTGLQHSGLTGKTIGAKRASNSDSVSWQDRTYILLSVIKSWYCTDTYPGGGVMGTFIGHVTKFSICLLFKGPYFIYFFLGASKSALACINKGYHQFICSLSYWLGYVWERKASTGPKKAWQSRVCVWPSQLVSNDFHAASIPPFLRIHPPLSR